MTLNPAQPGNRLPAATILFQHRHNECWYDHYGKTSRFERQLAVASHLGAAKFHAYRSPRAWSGVVKPQWTYTSERSVSDYRKRCTSCHKQCGRGCGLQCDRDASDTGSNRNAASVPKSGNKSGAAANNTQSNAGPVACPAIVDDGRIGGALEFGAWQKECPRGVTVPT